MEEEPKIGKLDVVYVTPLKLRWSNVFVGLLVGAVVIVIGVTSAYFIFGGSTVSLKREIDDILLKYSPADSGQKTTSPSPKQTTGSALPDEAKNWKDYAGESAGIRFSFKYPPHFKEDKLPLGEANLHTVGTAGATNNLANGDILIIVLAAKNVDIKAIPTENATFATLTAKKSTGEEGDAGIIAYYINNQPPITKDIHFTFECRFNPPTSNNLKGLCEQIASTFRFE